LSVYITDSTTKGLKENGTSQLKEKVSNMA